MGVWSGFLRSSRKKILSAAKLGDCDGIADVLAKNPKLVDTRGKDGTPLLLAVHGGHKDAVELLLSRGALLTDAALYIAVRNGSRTMAEFLLDHGANVNAKDLVGFSPLHHAAMMDDVRMAKLLIERGADVNAIAGEVSVLHIAILLKRSSVFKLLTENDEVVMDDEAAVRAIRTMLRIADRVGVGHELRKSFHGIKIAGRHSVIEFDEIDPLFHSDSLTEAHAVMVCNEILRVLRRETKIGELWAEIQDACNEIICVFRGETK